MMTNSTQNTVAAERSVLGSLMRFPELYPSIAATLDPSDFLERKHADIYRVMRSHSDRAKSIDPITLSATMGQSSNLAELLALSQDAYSKEAALEHARIVRDAALMRSLAHFSQDVGRLARDHSDVESAIGEATKRLSVVSSRLRFEEGAKSFRDILPQYLVNFKERAKNKTGIVGLATGFKEIDRMTSGLHPADMVVVGGRPSMGKTSFAMNIAENVALGGARVLVFSMEMPREAIFNRSVSSLGRIDQTRLRSAKLSDSEFVRFEQAVRQIEDLDVVIDDRPALTLAALSARAHEVHREKPLSLIVIDYLQLMSSASGTSNRSESVGEISRGLKQLAKELGVPLVVLSQLNRSLEQRPNKRPVNSDLRDSGSIEQDADVIIFVYRDEVYDPDSPDKGTAEIIISKQRNGPLGTARVAFQGAFTRFEDLSEDSAIQRGIDEARKARERRAQEQRDKAADKGAVEHPGKEKEIPWSDPFDADRPF